MARPALSPEARLCALAARWAQQNHLPAGNLWEPAIVRYMVREWQQLGGDANAYAHVAALTAIRLNVEVPPC